MSYIESKLIKGNYYSYLRESIRIGKKVIHKNIRYLGRTDSLGRKVEALETTLRREPIEPIKEIVKPISKIPIEKVTRIKKVSRIKFKLPKAIRQMPISPEREIAIDEIKKKKNIKKKIKKLKKKDKKEISEEETKKLFTFV